MCSNKNNFYIYIVPKYQCILMDGNVYGDDDYINYDQMIILLLL